MNESLLGRIERSYESNKSSYDRIIKVISVSQLLLSFSFGVYSLVVAAQNISRYNFDCVVISGGYNNICDSDKEEDSCVKSIYFKLTLAQYCLFLIIVTILTILKMRSDDDFDCCERSFISIGFFLINMMSLGLLSISNLNENTDGICDKLSLVESMSMLLPVGGVILLLVFGCGVAGFGFPKLILIVPILEILTGIFLCVYFGVISKFESSLFFLGKIISDAADIILLITHVLTNNCSG